MYHQKKGKKMKVHEEHKTHAPKYVNIALVIVSTSRYNELQEKEQSSDKTVNLVMNILESHKNISLISAMFIPDSADLLNTKVYELVDDEDFDAIILSGGTGLSPKDVTYETISPMLEKELPGFGELFRNLSYEEIGSSAMLSRATAGVIKKKIVFLLPGSPNAVKLALEKLIFPELGHMVYLINKEE
jgi:molybdenum cofactor biosynthesis protein B